ncbi:MAG TPA: DNA-binding transcriptional regulator [Pirellulales bacterium]|nr:DNA-binding transcriptional regulator [Pirellulales bacterium]
MKPTKQIAVLIETSRAYGRGLLRGVSRFHREHGTWSISFKPEDRGTRLQRWLKSWRGDGILARVGTPAMAAAVAATGLPFIDLRGASRPLGMPGFGCENDEICRLAFEHLSGRGLRHFAFVGEPVGFHIYDDHRSDSFAKIVRRSGGVCHVFQHPRPARGAITWQREQRQLAAWIERLPKPVGILAVHDDRGLQVLEACRALDVAVPDQVAVIGIDNDEFLCKLAIPSLSSIDPNAERIGYEAALLLDRMVDGRARFTRPRYFPPAGVVARQSTDVLMADDRDVAAAVRFIRQSACQRITVKDVERQVPLSRSLLNRRFKQVIGHTPKQEIVRVQIEAARHLLVDTDLPIAEIAALCGFSEAKYFIAVFARLVGNTPRAFRIQSGRANRLGQA